MASQGERLRMRRSILHTIFRRSGTNNSPRWCLMFGSEWPLPWYAQTAFWSEVAGTGTGNVPAALLSLTDTPWTTGVPGQSNRSLTGPYWSSMLLPPLLASCVSRIYSTWLQHHHWGGRVTHGSHSEPVSWFREWSMHYISGRLESWVESAA